MKRYADRTAEDDIVVLKLKPDHCDRTACSVITNTLFTVYDEEIDDFFYICSTCFCEKMTEGTA
jgi:hypothetical protein